MRPSLAVTLCQLLLAVVLTSTALAQPAKWNALGQRERTFLRFVLNGDAAQSQEYAQAAGINVNSIAGEPLSAWFYRMGGLGQTPLYDLAAQRVVFETFRQNPNPQNIGDSNLKRFCAVAPYPQELVMRSAVLSTDGKSATPEFKAVMTQIAEKQRPHVEAMAERFASLVRYGLSDQNILRPIFAGCLSDRNWSMTPAYYDLLIKPMLRGGMNINQTMDDGRRVIEYFVRSVDAVMVERLMQDGAQVRFPVKGPGCAEPTNLYVYLMSNLKPADPTPALGVVKLLSAGGLSPMQPIAYGGYQCRHGSLYDAVLDTGNMRYAQLIKLMYEAGQQQSAEILKSTTQAPAPAAAVTSVPVAAPPAAAVPSKPPKQIGDWQMAIQNDGRPMATAPADKGESQKLMELQMVCLAGGKLGYVAIASQAPNLTNSLWIDSAGDVYRVGLANGFAAGSNAVAISQRLLAEEAGNQGNPAGDKLQIQMSVDSPTGPMSEMKISGFSKMRAYMLANCKK